MDTAEVLIIGAGPAGLSSAITLASEGRSVILFERREVAGGQLGTSSLVENFPPHPDGFSGREFLEKACKQCGKFGVQLEYNTDVQAIIPNCDSYTLATNHGYFHGRVILLAMGLASKPLDVPGSDLPQIHLGMNTSALEEVEGKRVVLVGGGNSAGQAACYYHSNGAQVSLVVRRPIKETMSRYLTNRVEKYAEILVDSIASFREIKYNSGSKVCIQLDHSLDGIEVDCVHVFIGMYPPTEWLYALIHTDEHGYILADHYHQTNHPGIFAVGDVVAGSIKRATCAVGRGNEVVPSIHKYLDGDIQGCYLHV